MEAAILKNTDNNKIKKLILSLKLMHIHTHLIHVVFFLCKKSLRMVILENLFLLLCVIAKKSISSVRE